jgi:DNA invertase Pin-like site-specific DNA recombinase
MLCAIYCRVSTEDQNCDLQLSELREYAERRKWLVFAEYVDSGWSGAKASRPQLNKLMRDASQHRFDTILVWKLDRFGRSVLNFVEQLEKLESYGVGFMCISQSIDTSLSSPTSKLLMHILAAVAEFERSMIMERVRAGMKAAKHRGVHCGRKSKIFDHDKALQMRQLGKTERQIARALRLGNGTVHRLLAAQK